MIRLSKAERREIVACAARQIEYNRYSMRDAIETALELTCPRAIEGSGYHNKSINLTSAVWNQIEEAVRSQVDLDRRLAKVYGQVLPMDEPIEL